LVFDGIFNKEEIVKLPTIILLRHGQTKWNVEGRYQGQLNSDLTNLGKSQVEINALKIGQILEKTTSIKLFSSPLGRAKESAFILSDSLNWNKKDIIFDDNVQEIHYGIFEGKTKKYCQEVYKKEFEAREADKWNYVLDEGGESYAMVIKRLDLWLNTIQNEKIVVLVAHEMINRALRGIYCSYSKDKILKLRQSNDVVIKLENHSEIEIE